MIMDHDLHVKQKYMGKSWFFYQ